jgi:hypothetical protein
MNRIILFHFHDHFEVCKNRLEMFKTFNPHIPILGLYGGPHENFKSACSLLEPWLMHVYEVPVEGRAWKWQHGDLCLRMWHRDIGMHIPFDMLHQMEWDILFFDDLENVYSHVLEGGVGLTALTPLEKIEHIWSWAYLEYRKKERAELLAYVKEKFSYEGELYACQGPASCFSRSFLDQYAAVDVPELLNVEFRLPLFAQIFGIPLFNNHAIYREILDKEEMRFFNCEQKEIERSLILEELAKPWGRRVFHPFYEIFELPEAFQAKA